LMLFVSTAAAVHAEETYQDSERKGKFARLVSLSYMSLGVTFGGTMYSADKIPRVFEFLSFLSSGYWSNMGILAVVLQGQELPCHLTASNETAARGAGAACGIQGNVLLKGIGISDRPAIPTFGLLILLIGSLITAALVFPALVPFHRTTESAESSKETSRPSSVAARNIRGSVFAKKAFDAGRVQVHTEMNEQGQRPGAKPASNVVV